MPSVLACTDLSPFGPLVLEHAAWCANRLRAAVRVLHILPPPPKSSAKQLNAVPFPASAPGGVAVAPPRTVEELFARAGSQLRRFDIERFSTEARQGVLVTEVQRARAEAALVVIGKRGEHAANENGIGQHVQRLLTGTRPPMLVVSRPQARMRVALVAFDGRLAALRTIRFLSETPLVAGMHIHLLGVGRKKAALKKQLEAAHDHLLEAGRVADAQWLPGEPERVIPVVLKYEDIDLLVMGAFGDPKVRRFIRGSTTAALIRAAEMPVLVL